MDLDKINRCQLCGWIGRTHLHHIIPLRKNGTDNIINIIEICPNHHSEALNNEEKFATKFNLIGERKSQEELDALIEFANLYNFNFERFRKYETLKLSLMEQTRQFIRQGDVVDNFIKFTDLYDKVELKDFRTYEQNWIKLKYLTKKYKFDEVDAVSYLLGVTRNALINNRFLL